MKEHYITQIVLPQSVTEYRDAKILYYHGAEHYQKRVSVLHEIIHL